MADATVRVSGVVLNVDTRRGTSRAGDPYAITEARVLVEETGTADITLPDALPLPIKGEPVDYIADVTTYNGRAQLRAVRSLA